MRTYEHINDCWNALREAKTLEEVNKLFGEFPRWSGSWSIEKDGENLVVVNELEDEVNRETLDIDLRTTYYVSFERQGNTELVIKVKALDEDEAYEKAYQSFINNVYDTFCDTECPTDLESGQLVDELGCETEEDE